MGAREEEGVAGGGFDREAYQVFYEEILGGPCRYYASRRLGAMHWRWPVLGAERERENPSAVGLERQKGAVPDMLSADQAGRRGAHSDASTVSLQVFASARLDAGARVSALHDLQQRRGVVL